VDFEELFMTAVEAGALDVIEGDGEDAHEVLTEAGDLHTVAAALKDAGMKPDDVELVMLPQNEVTLEDREAVRILRLIDEIEDLDDVRRVFSNLEMTEEAVSAYAAAAA
jgi:transcriptional/translational regulatory protein YebC/TACO1